jgi:hypothetical protein
MTHDEALTAAVRGAAVAIIWMIYGVLRKRNVPTLKIILWMVGATAAFVAVLIARDISGF